MPYLPKNRHFDPLSLTFVKKREAAAGIWANRCTVQNEIQRALARGEYLEAYDLAQRALAASPDDLELAYACVLALSRSGATRQAQEQYEKLQLWARAQHCDPKIAIDVRALRAHILKDAAQHGSALFRDELLRAAAQTYETVFESAGASFPAINAATLFFLAGDKERARDLARRTLKCLDRETAAEKAHFFFFATRAEALLLLADLDGARDALQRAVACEDATEASRAITRRQLTLICDCERVGHSLLAPLAARCVIHYAGHIFKEDFEATDLRRRIDSFLAERNVGYGFGSLAAGSDILFAEALLARGATLNVVMPFRKDEFRGMSVTAYGESWGKRFDEVFARATTVHYATEDAFLGDEALFTYGSSFAMGLATLQAQYLDAPLVQAVVFSGDDRLSEQGTSADIRAWKAGGRESIIFDAARSIVASDHSALRPSGVQPRVLRAMIFGDLKGFSTLSEAQIPVFVEHVLCRYARVLSNFESSLKFQNTWGDGLYAVFNDARSAAECAMMMQAEMASLDLAAAGLPAQMGLRLGAHFGPVFKIEDPVLRRANFMGAHISRTARIEPVTPEGAVFVTEAFAAQLALSSSATFRCEYVGQTNAAKHYGKMRMYALVRANER